MAMASASGICIAPNDDDDDALLVHRQLLADAVLPQFSLSLRSPQQVIETDQ